MHNIHEYNIEVFIFEVTVNDFIAYEYTLLTDKCARYKPVKLSIDIAMGLFTHD
ncbi:hypothetical protein DPMN_128458 [Dreissena polymorpha]|uniref:Uncharacterized protein n=1 Tax=Dreissena polymorpha TaxID=45954 RepID=A0A9D4JZP7_DREPO|nr:hypothetical protein DPMN_128458 [Dreissena polymorpha]